MRLFRRRQQHKFCPVCGTQLRIDDAFCLKCGYSFTARNKRISRRLNWKNLILLLIVLIAAYVGLRYTNGQPLIPTSFYDAFNFTG